MPWALRGCVDVECRDYYIILCKVRGAEGRVDGESMLMECGVCGVRCLRVYRRVYRDKGMDGRKVYPAAAHLHERVHDKP